MPTLQYVPAISDVDRREDLREGATAAAPAMYMGVKYVMYVGVGADHGDVT